MGVGLPSRWILVERSSLSSETESDVEGDNIQCTQYGRFESRDVASTSPIYVCKLRTGSHEPEAVFAALQHFALSGGANCMFCPLNSVDYTARAVDSDLVQRLIFVKPSNAIASSGPNIRSLSSKLLVRQSMRLNRIHAPAWTAYAFTLWFPPNTNTLSLIDEAYEQCGMCNCI